MIDLDQTHVELSIEEILYEYCNLLYLLYVTHFDVNMTHLMYQTLTQKYRYTKGEKDIVVPRRMPTGKTI